MSNKKKDQIKEYKYVMLIKCVECETVSKVIGPCVKCGCTEFKRVYIAKGI